MQVYWCLRVVWGIKKERRIGRVGRVFKYSSLPRTSGHAGRWRPGDIIVLFHIFPFICLVPRVRLCDCRWWSPVIGNHVRHLHKSNSPAHSCSLIVNVGQSFTLSDPQVLRTLETHRTIIDLECILLSLLCLGSTLNTAQMPQVKVSAYSSAVRKYWNKKTWPVLSDADTPLHSTFYQGTIMATNTEGSYARWLH